MSNLKTIVSLTALLIVSACAGGKTHPPIVPDAISSQPSVSVAADDAVADAEQGFKAAREAYKTGNSEKALFIALRIIESYPDTPWYKRSLFLSEQALIRLDRVFEAEAAMLRVQAEYPELADYAVFLLADYHAAAARYSEAAALYGQVNELYPGSFLVERASFKRAQALLESYSYPEAAAAFEEWLPKRLAWYERYGVTPARLRLREHAPDELAHYAKKAVDVEYRFPFGWKELEGVHNRGDQLQ